MARALALGFLVGFPIAASPGPMFFLVLRRTVSRGWRSGVVSGLGVATGDAIYAALAAFGVAAITNVLLGQRRWIALVGGIAIALIGLRTLRPHPDPPPHAGEGNEGPRAEEGNWTGSSIAAYGSMVALTLGNPPTIISFAAIFAGVGIHVASGWGPAAALVAGVLLGSAAWWIGMTGAAAMVRERMTPAVTHGIAIVSGIALVVFGALSAFSALR
jgi:threonine/homoserine/homoserine lactone efflux protein